MRMSSYLLLAMLVGIACAAIGWLGVAGWLAMAVILASIAAHVAGNAIGTGLREATDQRIERPRSHQIEIPPQASPLLGKRTTLGRVVPVSVCIGAVCGGIAGTYWLLIVTRASLAGAMLGGVSSAVIGGLAGFLAASFVEIVRTSLREAIAAERRG